MSTIDTTHIPRYRCHKEVHAARIYTLQAPPPGGDQANLYTAVQGQDHVLHVVTAEWFNKHKPEVGGYLVIYSAGTPEEYLSYSPAKAFEEGYSLIHGNPPPADDELELACGDTIKLIWEEGSHAMRGGLGAVLTFRHAIGWTMKMRRLVESSGKEPKEFMKGQLKDWFDRHIAAWMAVDEQSDAKEHTVQAACSACGWHGLGTLVGNDDEPAACPHCGQTFNMGEPALVFDKQDTRTLDGISIRPKDGSSGSDVKVEDLPGYVGKQEANFSVKTSNAGSPHDRINPEAVAKATFKPEAETGWVIERGPTNAPEYYTGDPAHLAWDKDHELALRLARQMDACRIMSFLSSPAKMRVAEHSWG